MVPSVVPVPRPMTRARSNERHEERREVREAALRRSSPGRRRPGTCRWCTSCVTVAAARDRGDAAVHVLAHHLDAPCGAALVKYTLAPLVRRAMVPPREHDRERRAAAPELDHATGDVAVRRRPSKMPPSRPREAEIGERDPEERALRPERGSSTNPATIDPMIDPSVFATVKRRRRAPTRAERGRTTGTSFPSPPPARRARASLRGRA